SSGGDNPGRMARKLPQLQRVLDAPALASVAYGEIASSIYFALGIIAARALGLTPAVLGLVGILFMVAALSYAEGTAALRHRGRSPRPPSGALHVRVCGSRARPRDAVAARDRRVRRHLLAARADARRLSRSRPELARDRVRAPARDARVHRARDRRELRRG